MTRKLLTLNGLAVLCVVFYHATAWIYTAMFWWTDRYQNVTVPNFAQMGSPVYYGTRFIEQLVIFAIPTFIFVTGYFIAFATQRDQITIEWSIIFSRLKHLIIPYLLWSILILAVRWMEGVRYAPGVYLTTLLYGRAADPYYYVPLTVQLYLIAPFLVPIARKYPGLLLLITGTIQLALLVSGYSQTLRPSASLLELSAIWNWGGFFLNHIFWFCFGMTAGFHLEKFKAALARIQRFLPVAAIILFVSGMVEWEVLLRLSGQDWIAPKLTPIDHLYSGMIMLSMLAYSPLPPALTSRLAILGGKSFGVYLLHAPVLEITARLVYHLVPVLLAFQAGFLVLLVALSLGLPLLLMAAVNRSPASPVYKYIFG